MLFTLYLFYYKFFFDLFYITNSNTLFRVEIYFTNHNRMEDNYICDIILNDNLIIHSFNKTKIFVYL
ncbi:MAG: hypothetical protein UR93_C0001G0027 [Berkelbacteria bacterium GW2011_GWA2_35_9]|uniref:Uncharacterized protein n=1 Tax=Berkelbacteria bacterium GW2011_GWA2_35_9 TaxID=1618333 RepID=A0A0G0FP54_9BACT|nr:MAG: hypothetical protein UR93_C0001G0027 [Berkelbacteria bacterium GW2011_GWA2_35_9]